MWYEHHNTLCALHYITMFIKYNEAVLNVPGVTAIIAMLLRAIILDNNVSCKQYTLLSIQEKEITLPKRGN